MLNKLISGTDHISKTATRKKAKVGIAGITGSSLYQIPVPEGLEERTYGCLFKHLSKSGIIPIGILRGVFTNMNIGPKGNKMPYVYTNPTRGTEIFSCDRVFVLSQNAMSGSKLSFKETVDNFKSMTVSRKKNLTGTAANFQSLHGKLN